MSSSALYKFTLRKNFVLLHADLQADNVPRFCRQWRHQAKTYLDKDKTECIDKDKALIPRPHHALLTPLPHHNDAPHAVLRPLSRRNDGPDAVLTPQTSWCTPQFPFDILKFGLEGAVINTCFSISILPAVYLSWRIFSFLKFILDKLWSLFFFEVYSFFFEKKKEAWSGNKCEAFGSLCPRNSNLSWLPQSCSLKWISIISLNAARFSWNPQKKHDAVLHRESGSWHFEILWESFGLPSDTKARVGWALSNHMVWCGSLVLINRHWREVCDFGHKQRSEKRSWMLSKLHHLAF